MAADEYSDSGFDDMIEASGMVPRADQPKDNLIVRFFIKPHKNEKKSKDAGRPIYEDREMVEIRIPGDRDFLVRLAEPQDKARWARQYKAFKAGQDQAIADGFPLAEWALVTASMREELAYFGVKTVEQLANVPDAILQRMGPLMQLRQKARDWLDRAENDAVLVKLRNENDDLTVRVAALERMLQAAQDAQKSDGPVARVVQAPSPSMAEIVAAVAAAMTKPATPVAEPKRRGRPPKVKPVNGTDLT